MQTVDSKIISFKANKNIFGQLKIFNSYDNSKQPGDCFMVPITNIIPYPGIQWLLLKLKRCNMFTIPVYQNQVCCK